jgi:crotonobetainyl-CoA:carnitine CoA-transferase CaiB-like acyl-CoA transferase
LAKWCLPQTGDVIVEKLWAVGIPVAKVMQPHRQTELPQLRHRRFFEHVGHPVNVAASHSTLPVTLSNGPEHFHRAAAPLLGEHNHELLSGLGLSYDEILALEEDGVIGTAPAVGGRRRKAAREIAASGRWSSSATGTGRSRHP